MTTSPVDDADLIAWLCARLPSLSATANQYGWSHKLAAATAAIRAGTPAAEALANQGIPLDLRKAADEQAHVRDFLSGGDPATLNDLKMDPVMVTGPYTCPAAPPHHPCPRRAQADAQGHEPRCGVHDKVMTLRLG